MYRKEVNEQSPLRILEQSTKEGLGPGNLGVVMARAGTGKTAFLVQIGLDDAMRERPVLHVALGQDLEHVQSWYDALFDDMARITQLENREQVRTLVYRQSMIQAYSASTFSHEHLDEVLSLYEKNLEFKPKAILIDGFNWETDKVVQCASELGAFKSTAKRLGAELWMSAQTHRESIPAHPTKLTAPCDAYDEVIDLAVFLEPDGQHVSVRLLKDHENTKPADTHLHLHTDTMRLVTDEDHGTPTKFPAKAHWLLSGGAQGSETAFGKAAEKWGVKEIHFSFAGRKPERVQGLVELSADELERGGVSEAYIKAQLHRSFPQSETFQKLLKSIWHQVATAGQVFVVGEIQEDGTVKGGTGWAAELARHFHKPLFVFDQPKKSWYRWSGEDWVADEDPKIERTRFTGTGTRFLSEDGERAIEELFERSFGAKS